MSLMKQVSLLPAGCQPWNLDVCAASSNGDRFAYCATLAVYVYEVRRLCRYRNKQPVTISNNFCPLKTSLSPNSIFF